MTLVLEKLTDVQDGVVEAIGKVKEPAVKGVTVVIDLVNDLVPQMPALSFGKEIPTPVEFINNQYKFAKSVIDVNKEIALAIAKAAAPVTDTVLNRKSATATKPTATRATATKTAARKAS